MPAATHRELYPEQYDHPLVGQPMRTRDCKRAGIVSRVVPSMFGALAILGNDVQNAYAIADLQPMPQQPVGSDVTICGFNGNLSNASGEVLTVWACRNSMFYVEPLECEEDEGRYMSVADFLAWQKR